MGSVVERSKPYGGLFFALIKFIEIKATVRPTVRFTTHYYATVSLLTVAFLPVVGWVSSDSGVRWRSNYYFLSPPKSKLH